MGAGPSPAVGGSDQVPRSRTSRVLVRAFFLSRLVQTRFVRLLEALSSGVWLGLLSQRRLDDVDDAYYVGAGGERESVIDYMNDQYNRQGLFQWERRAIEEHFPPEGALALLAAGGGREVLALRELGYTVDAWECQPEFVESANRLLGVEGYEPAVSYAPRNTVPEGTERYDGVIVGWGAYTLIPGRGLRVSVLRGLRHRVDPGAPILLSFFARQAGDTRYRIAAALGNLIRRLLGRERLEVGDYLEPNFSHAFLEAELASELAEAGFDLLAFSRRPYPHAVGVATGDRNSTSVDMTPGEETSARGASE